MKEFANNIIAKTPFNRPGGKSVLALIWVCFFWGTTWIASKEGVKYIPAIQMCAIRQILGGSICKTSLTKRETMGHHSHFKYPQFHAYQHAKYMGRKIYFKRFGCYYCCHRSIMDRNHYHVPGAPATGKSYYRFTAWLWWYMYNFLRPLKRFPDFGFSLWHFSIVCGKYFMGIWRGVH